MDILSGAYRQWYPDKSPVYPSPTCIFYSHHWTYHRPFLDYPFHRNKKSQKSVKSDTVIENEILGADSFSLISRWLDPRTCDPNTQTLLLRSQTSTGNARFKCIQWNTCSGTSRHVHFKKYLGDRRGHTPGGSASDLHLILSPATFYGYPAKSCYSICISKSR
jgi:hypothetical protein